jgi:methionyl-tRNA formyltransferase
MTSLYHAKILTNIFIYENNKINIINFIHPNQLKGIPDDYLMSSRLISFGSTHYIPPGILDRIGYGSYNLHPGPPNYPGWAPFYYAIYDRASRYGVTFHEMNNKIDAGKIIRVRDFDIPSGSTTQELVNLTELHMIEMIKELAPSLVNLSEYMEANGAQWQREPLKKSDFLAICNIQMDISIEELNRRIFAFGDSDGTIFPYLIKDNKKYRLAFEADHPSRHSVWLHGKRFVIE